MSVSQRQPFILLFVIMILIVHMPALIKAQEDDTENTVQVQFNGHVFLLPTSLADGFSAFLIDQPTPYPDGSDTLQPPRTEFRLQMHSDTVNTQPAVGWINVYDVDDLEDHAAYDQYERLRDLLTERPDLNAEAILPTLYPYQRSALSPDLYTEFFVNAAYIESADYRGITFIYGRVIHANNRQPILFYRVYFEGISSDGQRYLSAQIEGLPGLITSLDGVTDPDDYLAQAQALFHNPTDDAVIAWFQQAELMFASFDYTPPPQP